ncbi:MAG TPA: response regulator transcription factor [Terriglobales bacterium]|nr:response regulator transcription factor [Terriglobales bacterium]
MQPPRGKKRIAIIVADANVMASGFVCEQLKKRPQFEVVGRAASAGAVLELLQCRKAKVALISTTLQDGFLSGLAMFPEIREKHPDIRLVLMIDYPERELVLEAFRAGARGIFSRYESQFDALCECISCVHNGQIWANAQQLNWLLDTPAPVRNPRLTDAKGLNLLTKREEEIVQQVAEGLSNRDIARHLRLSDHTVKNHLFHIFDKLGISNRVELVLYAVSHAKRTAMSVPSNDSPADFCTNKS